MSFKFANLLGERRLADAAALRRAAEMFEFGDRFDVFEVAKRKAGKGFLHSANIIGDTDE